MAWVDPNKLSQWWGPRGVTIPVCEVNLRVGGIIHVVMLAGKELGNLAGQRWPMEGIFKEIQPNEKLVFANNAVDEQNNIMLEGQTTVLLEDQDLKTKLTLTTSATWLVPQAPQIIAGMEAGWNQSLDKLSEFIRYY